MGADDYLPKPFHLAELTARVKSVVAEQLRAVGVNAKVQLVDWQTWYDDAYKARKFQSTVVGLDASYMTARAMSAVYQEC